MSDEIPPKRFIAGPPPIRKATSLNRETRVAAMAQDSPVTEQIRPPEPIPEAVPSEGQPAQDSAAKSGLEGTYEVSSTSGPSKVRITFDIPKDLRLRARAMFKDTRTQENDSSFAGMLCTIIERECLRREQIYNGGAVFTDNSVPLPAGRPLL